MQIDNLYTTATSINVGETTNQYRDEYTSTITQIYSSEGSVSQDAYWLGWISYDNLPIYCQHNTVNEDENSIAFVNDTVAQNYPIGYVYNGGFQVYNSVYMQDDEPFATPANTCRFINNMYPEYSAQMVSSDFGNIQIMYSISIADIYRLGGYIYCTDTGGLTSVLSWLNGETTRTLTFTYSGNTFTIDVDLSQMTDTYFLEIPTNEDVEVIITFSLIQILFSGNTRYKNGTSYGNTFISPSTRIFYDNGDETGNYNCFVGSWGNTAMAGFAAYYDNIGYVRYRDEYASPQTNETRTGCTGTFLKADIAALPDNGVLYNNNIMAYRRIVSGNDRTYFVALLSPKDIITAISLFYRVYYNAANISANPTISSYVENISWATDVNEDNEFLGVLKTGNITDSEFRNGLRTWQYTSLQYNDFTKDDIPEYNPEPGGGGDEDEGSIPLNVPGALGATNAFTTRYVLNTTQIRTIGQQLWSTIGDGNELTWQNFFLTLSGSDKIDYSLTLSEIISYFVSLKYFPFNLNSVSSTTGENGIRVGTGTSLISAGSTTKTLNDSIVQLDGGRCTIPEKWNNYLDLEPYTTASLYVPYCGTMELPMSVIAGETIGITYLVDMTTGAMTAAIMKYSGSGAYFPIAIINGSCGFDILMTGTNGNSQMTNAITNLASKSTQWVGQTLQSGLTGLMGGISGRDSSGMGALSGMASTVMGIGQDMIQQNIQMPKLYATAPMTSGSSSSLSSLILPQTAYIQIRRHNPYRLGVNYQDELGLIGCRSAYQGLISSANGMGFVKCQNPNLANVADAGATEAEINMIKSLLSDGIFT